MESDPLSGDLSAVAEEEAVSRQSLVSPLPSAHRRVDAVKTERVRKISLPERVVPFRRRTSPADASYDPVTSSSSGAVPKRKVGVFSRPPVFNGLFQRNSSSPDSPAYVESSPPRVSGSPSRDSGGSGEDVNSPRHRAATSTFSRIFSKPIQRSKSAGSSEAPPHALFLRQGKSKATAIPAVSTTPPSNAITTTNGSGSPKATESVYEGEKMERKKKKSIGQDVRQRLSIFRRQAGGSSSATCRTSAEAERLLKTPLPDEEAVRRWSDNFDALLQDKYGLTLFHSFLKTEFSEENIEFWIACEEYKNISTTRKLHNKAQKIYNDYIAVQAPREVNLDSNTRVMTIRSINSPTRHTFDQAQKRIQALMDKDSYQRFLRSDLYIALQREVREASNSNNNKPLSSVDSTLTALAAGVDDDVNKGSPRDSCSSATDIPPFPTVIEDSNA